MAEVKAAEAHLSTAKLRLLQEGPEREARQARLDEERRLWRKVRGLRLAVDLVRRLRGKPASTSMPNLGRATNVEEAIQKALDQDEEKTDEFEQAAGIANIATQSMQRSDLPGERIRIRLRVGVEGSDEIEGFATEKADVDSDAEQETKTAGSDAISGVTSVKSVPDKPAAAPPKAQRMLSGGPDVGTGDEAYTDSDTSHTSDSSGSEDWGEDEVYEYTDDTQQCLSNCKNGCHQCFWFSCGCCWLRSMDTSTSLKMLGKRQSMDFGTGGDADDKVAMHATKPNVSSSIKRTGHSSALD